MANNKKIEDSKSYGAKWETVNSFVLDKDPNEYFVDNLECDGYWRD